MPTSSSEPAAAAASRRFVVRHARAGQAQVQQRLVEAASEAALRAAWREDDGALLSVRPAAAGDAPAALQAGRGDFDVANWCRELRTLLNAGMTVVEALQTLHAQPATGQRARVHGELLRALRQGQSLSRALRGAGVFPDVLVAGVTASERTGTLVSSLDDYLRYAELLARLRKQLVSAAIYPLLVMGLGLSIALFLLLYVLPRFSRMYVDFHGDLSPATRLLLALSRVLAAQLPLAAAAAAALALLAAWAWRRGWWQRAALALLGTVPPLQRQWDHFRLAKLYQSLALMFRGGYTLDEALLVCEGLRLGGNIAAGLPRARQALARGQAVALAFGEAGLTEVVSVRLLAVGERTGSFDTVLQTIAERHAQAFTVFIERTTRIVEPLLLLLVALGVGGIVVMMYMPIFDIANGVR